MRTIVLIDGQNLFHLAKSAWVPTALNSTSPYAWPSYDVERLASALVSRVPGRTLSEIRFYTGVPRRSIVSGTDSGGTNSDTSGSKESTCTRAEWDLGDGRKA